MKITTINKKIVLLEFNGNENKLLELSKESIQWITKQMNHGMSWGGFFILDENGDKQWGGGWEIKAEWNKDKWKLIFER